MRSLYPAAVLAAMAIAAFGSVGALAQSLQGSDHAWAAVMMRADANRDGAITKAEARTGREAMFARLDANSDGFIGAEERKGRTDKAGKRGGAGGRGGGGGDADGDGKVSRAEFMAAPYRSFDRFDTNRNDTLEATELAAARELMQQRKNGTP